MCGFCSFLFNIVLFHSNHEFICLHFAFCQQMLIVLISFIHLVRRFTCARNAPLSCCPMQPTARLTFFSFIITLVQFKCMHCSVQCTIYYWKGHKGHILPYAFMHIACIVPAIVKILYRHTHTQQNNNDEGKKVEKEVENTHMKWWKLLFYFSFFFSFFFPTKKKIIWVLDIEQCDKQCIDCTTFASFVIITIMTINGTGCLDSWMLWLVDTLRWTNESFSISIIKKKNYECT